MSVAVDILSLHLRADLLTWCIAGAATAGVILRPFRWPEAVWAMAGAALLLLLRLLTPGLAWAGVMRGLDVYLFLAGMMLLSELARREGLFDWLAALATAAAKGSATRLFALVYAVGILVTAFLSNDATAVVLTPAVYAAARAARVADPLPYLLACAFVANAASFVLPISNPANLVVYGGGRMPPLAEWLGTFALPSAAAIATTYAALRLACRRALAAETIAAHVERPALSLPGRIAGIAILLTTLILVGSSWAGLDLGLPTLAAGGAAALVVTLLNREAPTALLKGVSWGVLPLVAGLFVLVEALDRTGVVALLAEELRRVVRTTGPGEASAILGSLVALATNLGNNLPVGLLAASAVQEAGTPPRIAAAILVGVDLGPNLSVTGSLATILWLAALRREGLRVTAWQFLKIGLVVMPPALVLALAVLR